MAKPKTAKFKGSAPDVLRLKDFDILHLTDDNEMAFITFISKPETNLIFCHARRNLKVEFHPRTIRSAARKLMAMANRTEKAFKKLKARDKS